MNKIKFPFDTRNKEHVADLQNGLMWLLDRNKLRIDESDRPYYAEGLRSEQAESSFSDTTKKLVAIFQEEQGLPGTGAVDERTAILLNSVLEEAGAFGQSQAYRTGGHVKSKVSAAVGGLKVQIVDKHAGRDDVPIVETFTDDNGSYLVSFTEADLHRRGIGKSLPDLQAKVFGEDDVFLAASEVRYNVAITSQATLDVDLGDEAVTAMKSEYETMIRSLSGHFGGSLRDLNETDDRQDITYLANKTGWDARAVALASLADKFSADTVEADAPAIDPAYFYALFRAGVPAQEESIFRIDLSTAERVWKQALTEGVIPVHLEEQLPKALERFQLLARNKTWDRMAAIGVSPFKEIIAVSLGTDEDRLNQFASLYTEHSGDEDQFWESVKATFGETIEYRLKLDGQLAGLTYNNAPLMHKLHETVNVGHGITDARQLIDKGYYRKDAWIAAIGESPVPSEISGEGELQRRERYAELLAVKLRMSYPTDVVANMIRNDETPLADVGLKAEVTAFFKEQAGKFELGMHPVEKYVQQRDIQLSADATKEVLRIQRVNQITPTYEAMNAMLAKGLDSARSVVQYEKDDFVRKFMNDLGGERDALKIYERAMQVNHTVVNMILSYAATRNAPGIGVHGEPRYMNQNPNASDVLEYPALEALFDNMDYFACEPCRSIHGPAAYLVELLRFLDRPVVPDGFRNPQTVLLERRPEIEHIPLDCENTNTTIPYIDLVIETLEFYIVHGLNLTDFTGNSPQAQTISDKAYEILAGKPVLEGGAAPLLPPTLPFNQPLESLRRHLEKFELSLQEVMEALRTSDNMERAGADPFGWRDIWMEELRLSRAEYSRLTDRTLSLNPDNTLNLRTLFGYSETVTEQEMMAELSNPLTFARRLGLTYEDLNELLMCRFINPSLAIVPKLERLGVTFETIKKFKEGLLTDEQFDQQLAPALDVSEYGGDIQAWVRTHYDDIMGLITLMNEEGNNDLSDYDKMAFRYADPGKHSITDFIRPFEFIRMIRFIRLWRKLGWSIEQTDKAIAALYPAEQTPNDPDDLPNLQKLDDGFLILLPRLGIVKRVMDTLNLNVKKDLLPLLACFAPIDTYGSSSLYRNLFLDPNKVRQDAVFSGNGYGRYLTGSEKLLAHREALRAAFQLTDDEFVHIVEALGYNADTPLNLDNVSSVYRRGWLARKLRVSVQELLLLIPCTGIDPFAAPEPVNPQMLQLIGLIDRMREAPLKPSQALYLIWNRDIGGVQSPAVGEMTAIARTLRNGYASIDNEFAIAGDLDGQIAKSKLAPVYGIEAVDHFFGIVDNTAVTKIGYSHDTNDLRQDMIDTAAGHLAYDHLRKQLAFNAGIMPDAMRDALKGLPGASDPFKQAIDDIHHNSRVLFKRYPGLLNRYNEYVSNTNPPEIRTAELFANLMLDLKPMYKRQYALQTIGASAGSDSDIAAVLLDDASVLHAADDISASALHDFTAMETPGLSVKFYHHETIGDNEEADRISPAEGVLDLAFTAAGGDRVSAKPTPASVISGIWSGYLEVPASGFYNFLIEADADAIVTLAIGGEKIELDLDQDGVTRFNAEAIEFKGGALVEMFLKVEKVKDLLRVRWETGETGRETIPARYLYPQALIDRMQANYVRFLKAISLMSVLKLTTAEFAWIAARTEYRIEERVGDRLEKTGWMNSLPVAGNPGSEASASLLDMLQGLLHYSVLKAELSPGDERLLSVLREVGEAEPGAGPRHADSLLYKLTRWEKDSLDAWLARFNLTLNQLSRLDHFRKIDLAHKLLKKLRVPVSTLVQAATNEPDGTVVRSLNAALRARYEEEEWTSVIQSVNDKLRKSQRDALVAYILHQMMQKKESEHLDTPEKLFEYFLMDVEMEPCMQTTRILFATAAVQLYTERCLMNLEERVSPSSIHAKQWEWMKRYRVWEANRKVFLYPENWLEPELLMDASPLYKEALGGLLQRDITEEAAKAVYMTYLQQLDDLSRLEPCGMHVVENDPEQRNDDVIHVVARTSDASRKTYYRRKEHRAWTYWEEIPFNIQGASPMPVVWNDRLLLIWLEIQNRSNPDGSVNPEILFCLCEFYNGKWLPEKKSTAKTLGKHLGPLSPSFFPSSMQWRKDADLLFRIQYAGDWLIRLRTITGQPHTTAIPESESKAFALTRTIHHTSDGLEVWYFAQYGDKAYSTAPSPFGGAGGSNANTRMDTILKIGESQGGSHPNYNGSLQAYNEMDGQLAPWTAPFFVWDTRHVFLVRPEWKPAPKLLPNPIFIPKVLPKLIVDDANTIPAKRFKLPDMASEIDPAWTIRFGDKEIGPIGALLTTSSRNR
ncbi:PA14 domain-containing protein,virulence plasmid 28 protein [Paenibacillus hemerocallicola]|uniref:PA14 domain-containing protein,virulence plasmid 28 protein n=1 Tax=Paenibacillus hemerocallicola TaxID=1172614 RepID=A0A5C4T6X2_9BACL|nr:neuraminidase-like domain-containing protein [Paenibacillus hemerocallicola]TNJ64556.1 PA14 domain-containing protein,virulence plasmid 28 protein [Paenibacillus hemerocallicola]